MIVIASGRAALIAATGLFVLCVSPVQAQTAAEPAADSTSENASAAPAMRKHLRHASHHRRNYAQHRTHPTQAKADPDKPEKQQPSSANVATDNSDALSDIPPSVANANARMLLAGVQLSAITGFQTGTAAIPASSTAVPAGNNVPAATDDSAAVKPEGGILVAAADQLNDSDRGLHESGQTAAAANPSPPQAVTTMTSQASVWDQTSLIGKIFIGFGALLTMASAARMFMA